MRLWHPDYDNCLCIFKHKCSRHLSLTSRDMVTSVDFYPEEEAYFISGCMDRKLRYSRCPAHQGGVNDATRIRIVPKG